MGKSNRDTNLYIPAISNRIDEEKTVIPVHPRECIEKGRKASLKYGEQRLRG